MARNHKATRHRFAPRRRPWLVPLLVAAAVAVTIAGWQILSPTVPVGRFALIDDQERPVTMQTYRGKLVLVYFGYTRCPDSCPTVLNEMAETLDALGPQAAALQPLFITVDPARDTPTELASYVRNFDARIEPLTGTPAQIADAARSFRVAYQTHSAQANGDYLVDHSSLLFLLGRDGHYLGSLPADLSGASIANRLRPLL
jgi:protein SCO1/2